MKLQGGNDKYKMYTMGTSRIHKALLLDFSVPNPTQKKAHFGGDILKPYNTGFIGSAVPWQHVPALRNQTY